MKSPLVSLRWTDLVYVYRKELAEKCGAWDEDELDELFQLHAELDETENKMDAIVEELRERNIEKSKQQVRNPCSDA